MAASEVPQVLELMVKLALLVVTVRPVMATLPVLFSVTPHAFSMEPTVWLPKLIEAGEKKADGAFDVPVPTRLVVSGLFAPELVTVSVPV